MVSIGLAGRRAITNRKPGRNRMLAEPGAIAEPLPNALFFHDSLSNLEDLATLVRSWRMLSDTYLQHKSAPLCGTSGTNGKGNAFRGLGPLYSR
jgi:hypothetical protein